MFADPTVLKIGPTVSDTGGTSTNFARIRTDGYSSEYMSADGVYKWTLRHTLGARTRSELRLAMGKTYTDPSTGLVVPVSSAAYFVLNRPLAGFTNTELANITATLASFIGNGPNMTKVLALES